MATKHRYQVMPDPSPEAYAALEADIAAKGVEYPIHVDEEDNTLDGHQRRRICEERGIECPKVVIPGLTEAQKREHAWRMNLTRRHLSKAQQREIAGTLRLEGWTQDRIAQALGLKQRTVSRWLQQSSHLAKLPPPDPVLGKDGKRYPGTKARRRTAKPAEAANRLETSQSPSDAGDEPAQVTAQQETPQPRSTHAEARSPGTEPSVASGVPDALKTPPLVGGEWQTPPREQMNLPLGSSQIPSAEDHSEAHWVDALQAPSGMLETLRVQGDLLPSSDRWAPEVRARGMARIRHRQEILIALEAVVGADMGETADRNGHADAVSLPVSPPIGGEVQEDGGPELGTVSSAEAPVGDVAGGDQLPWQWKSEGNPSRDQVLPVQEEGKLSTQDAPTAARRTARADGRKDAPAGTRTRRSKPQVLTASALRDLTGAAPGASPSTPTGSSSPATAADPVERCSPAGLSKQPCPDHDGPEPSAGSPAACLDGASRPVSPIPMGSADAGDLAAARVPMAASAALSPLCPQCDSAKTWHIYGAPPDRFTCFDCNHHFTASTPGDGPSTRSQESS